MESNQRWLVDVPVATVWTAYDSARDLDCPAITNPVEIENWLDQLTYETKLDLCNRNLVQTQVLYGQEVIVTEEKNGWAHVAVIDQPSSKDENGYPGWIPKVQLVPKTSDRNLHSLSRLQAVVTGKKATLFSENGQPLLELSYLTSLPIMSEDADFVKVKTPSGIGYLKVDDVTVSNSLNKGNGDKIVSEGERFLGLPYLWGGMSSFGYDCSGFSYSMCKANGYIIPRDAHEQAKEGEKVELEDIKPGDLLFFAYEEGTGSIHHVGIYYGNGKLLHSPNTGKTIEIIHLEGTIYATELCAARRYWQDTEE